MNARMCGLLVVGVGLLVALAVGCKPGPSIQEANQKATAAYEAKDYSAAIGYWRISLDHNPSEYRAQYGTGIAYLALAEIDYNQQKNPPLALSDLDRAEYHLRACLESNPGDAYAQQALATLFRRRGQYRKALSVAGFSAQDNWPEARRYVFLGKELERQGDVDQAKTAYRQAIGVEPTSPDGYQALADLYRKLGNQSEADKMQAEADQRKNAVKR